MTRAHALTVVLAATWLAAVAGAQEQSPPAREEVEPRNVRPATREMQRQMRERVRQAQDRRRGFDVPHEIQFVADVVYATAKRDDGSEIELMLDAFYPKESGGKPLPAVIYIHGGGFRSGSKEQGNPLAMALAAGGYFSVSIDYRLTGDARFPAAVHDAKAAVRFLRKNAEELGIDPDRIGVWGHSAGGHLAAYLGTSGNASQTHGDVGEQGVASSVTCVVDFFGPADFSTIASQRRGGRGNAEEGFIGGPPSALRERARQASPIAWVDADDPPFLIIHGTNDDLVPIEQSRQLHEALKAAGVESELIEVEGAGHGIRNPIYYMRTAAFFDTHLGGAAEKRVQDFVLRPIDRQRPGRARPGAGTDRRDDQNDDDDGTR